jgi:NADH dehydrogenase
VNDAQTNRRPEVIVVGGGFAGLNVVKGLKTAPVTVTLLDKHNYHLFQPLLYQVATAVLSADNIAAPIRKILRHQRNVVVGLVEPTRVDLERQLVGHLARDLPLCTPKIWQ